MAGASSERQETSFVMAVKKAVKINKNNPITISAGDVRVSNVIDAVKYSGRQASGSEPYTDVVLILKNKKKVNISLKGEDAPSVAGGGLRGLEAIVPGIASKFMKIAHRLLLDQGLKAGNKVPDIFGRISKDKKLKIVIGNAAMGGPIDYMYLGKMDIRSKYEAGSNTLLFLNGQLQESTNFAATHDLYFRLRARHHDQLFDPEAMQGGIPKIYGKSPSRGETGGRIVVTYRVPSTAVIVKF